MKEAGWSKTPEDPKDLNCSFREMESRTRKKQEKLKTPDLLQNGEKIKVRNTMLLPLTDV